MQEKRNPRPYSEATGSGGREVMEAKPLRRDQTTEKLAYIRKPYLTTGSFATTIANSKEFSKLNESGDQMEVCRTGHRFAFRENTCQCGLLSRGFHGEIHLSEEAQNQLNFAKTFQDYLDLVRSQKDLEEAARD